MGQDFRTQRLTDLGTPDKRSAANDPYNEDARFFQVDTDMQNLSSSGTQNPDTAADY